MELVLANIWLLFSVALKRERSPTMTIQMIRVGDLLIHHKSKKSFIVVEIKESRKRVYGGALDSNRCSYKLMEHNGRMRWYNDTVIKVLFRFPKGSLFGDIR
jgi:hypothetical protein